MWLDRFVETEVISETAAFRIASVVDPFDGRRRFVVSATERARAELATTALARLFRAHRDPPHPVMAPAIALERHEGLPYVVFDFPARLDLDRLIQIGADGGWRSPYDAADGFSTTLRDAIIASAPRIDPEDGRPMCLGLIALGNVLFAVDGSHVLVGFGHNVVVNDEQGRVVARNRFFQAPEIALGGAPTLIGDMIGMIEMTRSMMPFVKVHPAIGRVIVGNTLRDDVRLFQLVAWFESRVLRGTAAARPSLEEIIAVSNEIRALLGSVPDPIAFRQFAARIMAAERPDLLAPGRSLRVGRDGAWFQRSGEERVELTRSQVQMRLLWRLARERLERPGQHLKADALLEALWPGERMMREAGLNRLYVAVNNLRRAGLGQALERGPEGYRLSPDLLIDIVDG